MRGCFVMIGLIFSFWRGKRSWRLFSLIWEKLFDKIIRLIDEFWGFEGGYNSQSKVLG